MKITCALPDYDFASNQGSLGIVLYGQPSNAKLGSAGRAIKEVMRRQKYHPAARAWDFLLIALSVVTSDLAGHRDRSPDGWTREFELEVAVADPTFWTSQVDSLESLLGYLTTDRWRLRFVGGGFQPAPERDVVRPKEDCVVLLSGGLDSFIGAIDLVANGHRPFAVSRCGATMRSRMNSPLSLEEG
jgi:hypothetical protein